MELLTLLAAPTLTALIAPVVLELIRKRIDRHKQERESQEKGADRNIALADELRDELRAENIDLKKEVDQLQDKITARLSASGEAEKWQAKFYSLRKDYRRLSFDVSLMRQELEFLRKKYDEYLAVRERAEEQFRRAGEDDG